ncbi:flagellar biosynthesis repressor FlbT [Sphingobium subterraneum]|uniref:Flagellar protein FlbT n=1 Tax=Sphingobium subterraneum TaxID=627688 RepID=A0A841IZV6_9SPHN|nr:flagellar biosynthesis repressor FlbT [Sphingobium subterraneum]MBB6124127.1 flagellar protein FlbT [Sphingobium subterraneum]
MLRINLRDGEQVVVNGAVLRACGRTALWLENEAAVLRGREVMKPEEANTPARRLYFACMMAYLDPAGRDSHQEAILILLGDLINAVRALHARMACATFARLVAEHDYYRALAECRTLIDHEAKLLGGDGAPAAQAH